MRNDPNVLALFTQKSTIPITFTTAVYTNQCTRIKNFYCFDQSISLCVCLCFLCSCNLLTTNVFFCFDFRRFNSLLTTFDRWLHMCGRKKIWILFFNHEDIKWFHAILCGSYKIRRVFYAFFVFHSHHNIFINDVYFYVVLFHSVASLPTRFTNFAC